MKKHEKHIQLTRRKSGNYAPQEIAVLGVKCSIIADFSSKIAKKLQKTIKIGYLDASHNSDIQAPFLDKFTFNKVGALELNKTAALNKNYDKIRFAAYDLLLINGNHYQGQQQILILDKEKEQSVLKRLDQLDNVQFLIKLDNDTPIFDFLTDKYPNIKNLPVYNIDEVDKIANHIQNITHKATPQLDGLVLAGGKSKRMGVDKGLLEYHGMAQRDYLFDLFKQVLDKEAQVYLSVREEQDITDVAVITDKFIGLGPFGAICSAFMHDPNKAYLVVATDLPFVNSDVLQLLLRQRNPKKIATAIKGKDKQFMEPLITIWEPKAYPVLLSYLAQGVSCPRKVLINSDVEIVEIDDNLIQNINTPQEFKDIQKQFK